MSESLRFPVDGMTCTSCVVHITKAVRKVVGVESVKVDLGSDSATVAFDAGVTSLAAIGEAIRRAGYEPRLELAEPALAASRNGLFGRLRDPLGEHR